MKHTTIFKVIRRNISLLLGKDQNSLQHQFDDRQNRVDVSAVSNSQTTRR
jgi:hypothetical protein